MTTSLVVICSPGDASLVLCELDVAEARLTVMSRQPLPVEDHTALFVAIGTPAV